MTIIVQHCLVIFVLVSTFQLLKKLPAKGTGVNNVNNGVTNNSDNNNTLFRFPTANEISEFI
jgi:hypothetical protein